MATALGDIRGIARPTIVGQTLYATESVADEIENRYQTNLVVVNETDTTTLVNDATDLQGTTQAIFYQHDGQLYRRSVDGETVQLTHQSDHITSFVPTPDGARVVFAVQVETQASFNAVSERPTVRYYTKRHYKDDGVGFIDEQRRFEIYQATVSGVTRLLGTFSLPVKIADATDTQVVMIVQTNDEDAHEYRSELRTIDFETKTQTTVPTNLAQVYEATIAPDATQILILGNDDQYPNRRAVSLHYYDGHQTRLVFDDEELLAEPNSDVIVQGQGRHVRWLDSETYIFETGYHGHTRLYQGTIAGEITRLLDEPQLLSDFAIADRELVIAQQDPRHPSRLITVDLGAHAQTVRYDANPTLSFTAAEKFTFASEDGSDVDGWFLPAHSEEPAPVVLYVHGGPHGAYGDALFWEFQRFAEAGYNVVFTNPHGSTTYGQAFINAVVNHYGEQDYRDVLAGLDRAIERYSDKIDATRQIIIGGSYGGFMTTWAIGHTDRFQAAVSQRPVTEWLHLTGASDIGYNFVADEMGATPYTEAGRAELIKRSPITYAGAVKTPLLMMHGEYDLRTPIAQTEMYFMAVKTLTDTPVEMVRFPQSWHGVSRNGLPNLRNARLTVMFEWLDKTLK